MYSTSSLSLPSSSVASLNRSTLRFTHREFHCMMFARCSCAPRYKYMHSWTFVCAFHYVISFRCFHFERPSRQSFRMETSARCAVSCLLLPLPDDSSPKSIVILFVNDLKWSNRCAFSLPQHKHTHTHWNRMNVPFRNLCIVCWNSD